jgi:hypothetical protein
MDNAEVMLSCTAGPPSLPSVFDGANQLCEALTIGEALPLAPFDEAIYVGTGSPDVDLVCRLFNRWRKQESRFLSEVSYIAYIAE